MKPEDARPERSHDPAPDDTAAHPASAGSLWTQLLSRENLAEALRRVERNAGAPGIDGMSTKELRPWLHDHWPQVRSALDAGTYRPQPVRRVMIPKPSGGTGRRRPQGRRSRWRSQQRPYYQRDLHRWEGPNAKPSARTFVLVIVALTAANPLEGLAGRVLR